MIDILFGIWLSSGLGYQDPAAFVGATVVTERIRLEPTAAYAPKIETGNGYLISLPVEVRIAGNFYAGGKISFATTSEWNKLTPRAMVSYRLPMVEVSGVFGKEIGAIGRFWLAPKFGVDVSYLRYSGGDGFTMGLTGRL